MWRKSRIESFGITVGSMTKTPILSYGCLQGLKEQGLDFELVLLGERYERIPEAMSMIQEEFSTQIVHEDWLDSREDYLKLLATCTIMPVTSKHEFYGYSVLEGMASGVFPVLPDNLVYPEYKEYLGGEH